MGLFQKSVLRKYLASQDAEACKAAYDLYVARFHDPHLQAQIGIMNEVEYQDGFLTHLFVNILGYTKRPDEGYNLVREKKNETDGKKADGAILRPDDSVIAVIELKGAKIKDLDKIDDQAWGYQRSHINCPYVITSNFEKLRFFIDNAVEHEEFNLFTLTQERFSLLWLCLQKDNLQGDLPKKVKVESLLEEEKVTKRLYKDYSAFKSDLWQDMCQQNPEYDELELYKKSQKLLDRFLFIFFAEDKGLLPPNSISQIVNQWSQLKELDAYTPLYDRLKLYFGYMNNGRKALGKEEIHAYNGGLFKTDELLDGLNIDDELLRNHCLKLSEYDFDTEVDTNILGHIFEHSLNDIENVRAELAGAEVDKSKTKRKKDGVFYTPKYITKYIVDNTVGKLCEEKKAEIGIEEEEFAKGRKGRRSDTLKKLDEQLKQYREWLLQLTICDPACGSGAFLNQTLEFLMAEHRYIDELESQLLGYAMVFQDVENHILERNIFGVDINEESVEIARLSLWLRTAQKGRTLTSLSDNIKVGNSLIDDPEATSEFAFNWSNQFPNVFEKGGFDVVIGNPPYVRLESIVEVSKQLSTLQYETFHKRGDLYALFVERGFQILQERGMISYIMPNKWMQAGYGKSLRSLLLKNRLDRLIDFGDLQIFEGATTYPCIFLSRKERPAINVPIAVLTEASELDFEHHVSLQTEVFEINSLSEDTWVIASRKEQDFLSRLNGEFDSLKKLTNGEVNRGIIPGLSEAFIIDQTKKDELVSLDISSEEIIGNLLRGRNITRYATPSTDTLDYIILAAFGSNEYLESEYPAVFAHLNQYEEKLKARGQCNGSPPDETKPFYGQHHWLELDNNPTDDYLSQFAYPKIMYQVFQVKPNFIFDRQGMYCNNSMWIIPSENSGLAGILNSKMGWWLISKYCTQIQNGYQLIWKYFGEIPIPSKESIVVLNNVVDLMIDKQHTLDKATQLFVELLQSKFPIDKPSKKLKNWPDLDFRGFLAELKKKKVELSLEEEAEWLSYFNNKKTETNTLQAEIDGIDKQIDQMVYELYGLSEEEIKIVEAS